MYGICGWSTGGSATSNFDDAALEALVDDSSRPAAAGSRATLLGKRTAVAVSNPDRFTGVARQGSLLAAISGLYHWQCDDPDIRDAASDPGGALLAAYRKYGRELPAQLSGCFSLAVTDDESGEIFVAVDRFGGRQLAYCQDDNEFLFSSNAGALGRFTGRNGSLDPRAIFAYLYFHNVPLPLSAVDGVRRVMPAHGLTWNGGSAVDTRSYADYSFDDAYRSQDRSALAAEIRERLDAEVTRLAADAETGTFLSGGIDSSSITALLARKTGSCKSFSIGFSSEAYDEMQFARTVARHTGAEHHEYYVTPEDIVAAVPIVAAANSEPFGNASAIPTYFCARLAKEHGIQRLLAGDGGDELFGGNERYAYDKLLAPYGAAPRFVRRFLERTFLPVSERSNAVVRKLGKYVLKSSTPLPERLFIDNHLTTFDSALVFEPEFFAAIDEDLPMALVKEQYALSEGASRLNRHLALDWYFTLACSDLPKVTNMSHAAGMQVAYPFLTEPVVEFSVHLPDREKVNGMKLRYFFKKAVAGILPPATITKSKHGFGLPFGVWLFENGDLRDFTFDNLSSLKKRGIVRAAFIDELTNSQLPTHPHFYGVMVWVLMMLEQYLQAHRDGYRYQPGQSVTGPG